MKPQDVLSYLRDLCRRLDEGRPLRPYLSKAVAPIVLPATVAVGLWGASALGQDADVDQGSEADGDTAGEALCDDEQDNDGDSLVDCDDPDCSDVEACFSMGVPEYAAMGCFFAPRSRPGRDDDELLLRLVGLRR